MAYTPYDWNQNLQQKSEYIEDRLRDGSPVVGVSFDGGVLLLTVKRGQRKVFEIYDRLMFAALGNQSDLETIRMGAIDVAHTEGYTRSSEDVTAHRIVSFAVSPPMKRAFADPFAAPFVVRGIFAELGKTPKDDQFFTLDYNGEFASVADFAVIAGTPEAESKALELLESEPAVAPSLEVALDRAAGAWATAQHTARQSKESEGEESETFDARTAFDEALKSGEVEIGLLLRNTQRERRFQRASSLDEARALR